MNPPDTPPCRVYVMDVSYFSGKVEAYLRYKRIPHTRIETHHALLLGTVFRHTGVAQVPAIELPDGTWLRDSTSILRWFEAAQPQRAIGADDPALAFLMDLIEDYADEWLWRPAMWWRWMPVGSAHNLGRRIAVEVGHSQFGPVWLKARGFAWRQRRTWLWNDGMTHDNASVIRDIYTAQLAALEAILAGNPFLLGTRPSLVDFGYFASMFRHFFCDPDSGVIMRREAPRVTEWVARMWNASELPDASTTFAWPHGAGWDYILEDIAARYLPYVAQNAAAHAARRRTFDADLPGLSLPGSTTHRHRVACLADLRERFQSLEAADRERALAPFAPSAQIDAIRAILSRTVEPGGPRLPQLPLRPELAATQSLRQRLRAYVVGTPR